MKVIHPEYRRHGGLIHKALDPAFVERRLALLLRKGQCDPYTAAAVLEAIGERPAALQILKTSKP